MSWSPAFVADLGRTPLRLAWRVVAVSTLLAPTAAAPITGRVLTTNVRVMGDAVEPVTWNPTWGGFEVEIVTVTMQELTLLAKGTVCQLQLSLDDGINWQPAALGVLQNVRYQMPRAVMSFGGLGPMLASRYDFGGVSYGLFANIGSTTTTTANYTAGDATVTVTSTADFERETGGSYLIQLSSGGTSFYLTATGSTGTTFTGCSSTGALGTTAANLSSGATVTEIAYIAGHPLDCARKILASTGTGTNGAYDTLPASWGLGLPDALLDHADIGSTRGLINPSSGSFVMAMTSDAAVTDPLAWLLGWLTPIAAWPTVRQGLVTFRAARIPHLAQYGTPPLPLTDATVQAVTSEWYFDSSAKEFYSARVTSDTGSTNTNDTPPRTTPAGNRFITEVLGVFANESAIRSEVLSRTAYWPTRPAEHYTVTCAGLGCWMLAPGDLVEVTTRLGLRRPKLVGGGNAIEAMRALVLSVQPTLNPPTVVLELAVLPALPD
jgi:hypothetical protein